MGSQAPVLSRLFLNISWLPDYLPALANRASVPAVCWKSRGDDGIKKNKIELLIFVVSSHVENPAAPGNGPLAREGGSLS